jgi:hypothetical protein
VLIVAATPMLVSPLSASHKRSPAEPEPSRGSGIASAPTCSQAELLTEDVSQRFVRNVRVKIGFAVDLLELLGDVVNQRSPVFRLFQLRKT